MRKLLMLLVTLFAAESAAAQVVYVVFRDRKIEKRYAKYLSRVNGVDAMVGEAKDGIKLERGVVNYTSGPEAKNALWVSDPTAPDKLPYRWVDGRQEVSKKKGKGGVVSFAGDEVQGIRVLDPLASLVGYAAEYTQRLAEIETLTGEQKAHKRGSKEWFSIHGRIVGRYLRLQTWLSNIGFSKAAEAMQKDIDKRRKQMAKDAAAAREKEALASVRQVETPDALTKASNDITRGQAKFHVQESRHMRVTYVDEIPDASVANALTLVERIVEGFRRDFVDPYVGDDFEDLIPEQGPLVEFYFGPPDVAHHERFLVDYYQHKWGRYKEQEIAASGALFYLENAPHYLHYRKYYEDIDLEGYLAHGIGATLADLQYNRGRRNDAQPWIAEAVGYYTALAYLGRNSITTFSDGIEQYARAKQESGVKTSKTGLRGFYNEEATQRGLKIDAIGPKELYQLTDQDFAKAWSFFDYVANQLGKPGQVWLRATCDAAVDRPKFMTEWRTVTEQLRPVDGKVDVFSELDAAWKEWAENEQILEIDVSR